MTSSAIKSPCINVCAIDAGSGWCLGCGRTLKEIAKWSRMDEDGREEVMADLPERITILKAQGKR